MTCKQTQKIIDTLLRFKVEDSSSGNNNNKIASIMSKTHDSRKKEEEETLCVHVLNQLIDQNNKNKIASVQTTPKIGEFAEFQNLLRQNRLLNY